MTNLPQVQIASTLEQLLKDAKYDLLKIMKVAAKSIVRPMQPSDFKEAYLSISSKQGEDLKQLIQEKNLKNIVEFGTSFGISTLYLASGAIETGGHIITTELIESKARKAVENFEKAGVADRIEVRVGDAVETLQGYSDPIDLLLLDGWKDLYLAVFQLLEPNFHSNTIVYVDNADMKESEVFLNTLANDPQYQFQPRHHGKVILITSQDWPQP